MKPTMRTLVWFRGKDLRLADHQPLTEALQQGEVVLAFVLDPFFFSPEKARELPSRMQFLLESLVALEESIKSLGSRLVLIEGKSTEAIPRVVSQWGITRVVAQRWTEPFGKRRDAMIAQQLQVPFDLFDGETLAAPDTIRTQQGNPYSVFTPFSKSFLARIQVGAPLPAPAVLPALPRDITPAEVSLPTLSSLGLSYNQHILPGGEREARRRVESFIGSAAALYHEMRDRLDVNGTSRASVDLKFGTISPRQLWCAVQSGLGRSAEVAQQKYLNELIWREFAHALLWDKPTLLQRPFRADFLGFPWRDDPTGWQAWVDGKTGYPVVDAASRQLLQEGFVHNRARMISASFLTKHLMISYQRGEAHYMKHLTDGDWAQNNMGWQWSAGCGCDAQPYFRVFQPVTQGQRFDPQGSYVRRYVPELAKLPAKFIHAPWEAPESILKAAGVSLDKTYPRPIIEHTTARTRFLESAKRHLKSTEKEAV
jgi:deoxyribodipyrimidine photo-lyase